MTVNAVVLVHDHITQHKTQQEEPEGKLHTSNPTELTAETFKFDLKPRTTKTAITYIQRVYSPYKYRKLWKKNHHNY